MSEASRWMPVSACLTASLADRGSSSSRDGRAVAAAEPVTKQIASRAADRMATPSRPVRTIVGHILADPGVGTRDEYHLSRECVHQDSSRIVGEAISCCRSD